MEKEMRTLYVEGVATHDGPESCVGVREGAGEALTGVRAGPVLSREIMEFGVPTLSKQAEGHIDGSVMRVAVGPCAVRDPVHVRSLHAREPGDPTLAWSVDRRSGRTGKAEAVIL
jgi:RNA-directed DNA polymerase